MPLTRRTFLHLLGLAAPAFALDPERLLWTPGAKTIFVPPAGGLGWLPPGELLDMPQFLRETAEALHAALDYRALTLVGGGLSPWLPHRSTISFAHRDPLGRVETRLPRHETLTVAARLAEEMRHYGATRMGRLNLPPGLLQAERIDHRGRGLSLSGLQDYSINHGRVVTRVDVLYG